MQFTFAYKHTFWLSTTKSLTKDIFKNIFVYLKIIVTPPYMFKEMKINCDL
jgi:hypothetical protein